jgi:hypothetical protein
LTKIQNSWVKPSETAHAAIEVPIAAPKEFGSKFSKRSNSRGLRVQGMAEDVFYQTQPKRQ